jgi:anti-anti-sigma factor
LAGAAIIGFFPGKHHDDCKNHGGDQENQPIQQQGLNGIKDRLVHADFPLRQCPLSKGATPITVYGDTAAKGKNMQYKIKADGAGLLVDLSGRLDFNGAAAFEALAREIVEMAPLQLTIDLTQVGGIDSVALGLLFLIRESVPAEKVVLRGAQPPVREILRLTHANTIFILE